MPLALALALGALASVLAGPLAPLPLAAGAAAAAALARVAPPSPRRLAALLAALLAGAAWGAVVHPAPPAIASPEGRVTLEGTAGLPRCEPAEDRCLVWLADATADGVPLPGRVRLGTHGDAASEVAEGARVRVRAFLRGARDDRNPGLAWSLAPPRWRWEARAVPWADHAALPGGAGLRDRARAHLRGVLTLEDPGATALYRALLLGERADLDDEVRFAFTDAGVAHLLAISGLHLGVVGWGLYRVLLALLLCVPPIAQAGRPPALAAALAAGALWLYVAAITPSDATLRAAVVLTFVLLGLALARPARPGRALALAACLLVLADPAAALGPSFQLSFAATGALVLGLPPLHARLRRLDEPGLLPSPRHARAARLLALAVASSTLTWVATAPLALAWFGQLAPAGLLTNLAAVPLVSLLVVPLGFTWLLLGLVAPPVAAALAPLPGAAAGVLLDLVDGWAALAGPSTHAAWPHLAGLAASAASVAALAGRRGRAAAAALLLVALASVRAAAPPPGELTLTALDVGHGDALVLRLPEGGAALVDTGGRARSARGDRALAWRELVPALTRLGVDRLDLLVVTHADHDHVGAAADLVRRLPVREVWLPPCDLAAPGVAALAVRAAAAGARVRLALRGPPFRWAGAELAVLWPLPGARGEDGRCRGARNDAAVVLGLRYAGRRLLLAADVQREGEARLVALEGAGLRADVLKVAHHGSRTSSTAPFLDAVRPALAVVSGRPTPGPMPPHAPVLTRLQRRRAEVHLTGRDGALSVTVGADGSLAVTRRDGRRRARGGGKEVLRPP